MARVELSPAALRKLVRVRDYIAEELDSPLAAQETADRILAALERLERFPDSGPRLAGLHDNIPARYAETRFLICGKYVAIYEHSGGVVRVLQLYHGAEDYIRHLFGGQ